MKSKLLQRGPVTDLYNWRGDLLLMKNISTVSDEGKTRSSRLTAEIKACHLCPLEVIIKLARWLKLKPTLIKWIWSSSGTFGRCTFTVCPLGVDILLPTSLECSCEENPEIRSWLSHLIFHLNNVWCVDRRLWSWKKSFFSLSFIIAVSQIEHCVMM